MPTEENRSPSLAGRRIVVTRTRDQASELSEKLRALGAEVLELPVLKISKEITKQTEADVMLEFGRYDWLVFTSGNGVRYFFEEFLRLFDDIRSLGLVRIAAIGDGTARRLAELHLRIEVQPKTATAGALADAMIETGSLDSGQVLVITGNLNRDELVEKLEGARAIVDRFQVYKTESVDLTNDPAAAEFRARGADAILFASSSSAEFFAAQSNVLALAPGATKPLAGSIGPQTSATMKRVGIAVDFAAVTPGLDELIAALAKKLGSRL
ncbi:MAG TPA: uroporphyrinogen-III synthase [Opitutaceae bacterium]|jgi:uroporphyrinogen-III synthase